MMRMTMVWKNTFETRLCRFVAIGITLGMVVGISGRTWGEDEKDPVVVLRDSADQEAAFSASAQSIDYGMISGADAAEWIDSAAKYACSTYPRTQEGKPNGDAQDGRLVYDPAKIWRAESDGKATGPEFLTSTPTDSAAAATALASGRKTYNGSINWGNDSTAEIPVRLVAIPQLAKQYGKVTGSVTTVPLSHATPAGLGGAHNVNRGNYAAIANEMYDSGTLDLVFGAGNPCFDDSGREISDPEKRNYNYVGGPETWRALKTGVHSKGWKLIETKDDFTKLAEGTLLQDDGFAKVQRLTGVPQVASTLQQGRTGAKGAQKDETIPAPYEVAMNENVPNEATMAVGALNFLKKRSDEMGNPGFYMILEGGAIDWAAHANQKPRIIEEIRAHQEATIAVLEWLKKNDILKETLVLSTADHETGLVWGPQSDRYAFDPLGDADGDGCAEFRFNSGGHSNSLVPFWIWGSNAILMDGIAVREDPTMATLYGPEYSRYLDNTDVSRLAARAITDSRSGIRNVIVLIGDGMGFNAIGASNPVVAH